MYNYEAIERIAEARYPDRKGKVKAITLLLRDAGINRAQWWEWKTGVRLPSGRLWKRIMDALEIAIYPPVMR